MCITGGVEKGASWAGPAQVQKRAAARASSQEDGLWVVPAGP